MHGLFELLDEVIPLSFKLFDLNLQSGNFDPIGGDFPRLFQIQITVFQCLNFGAQRMDFLIDGIDGGLNSGVVRRVVFSNWS